MIDNTSTAAILGRDDLDAVVNGLLDQSGQCVRCGKTDLVAAVNAYGWSMIDASDNPVIKVLCGHCSLPRRARHSWSSRPPSRAAPRR